MKAAFTAIAIAFFASSLPAAHATEQKAIDAFVRLQSSGSDPVLSQQASQLKADGFVRLGQTRAVALRGQCNGSVCTEEFLVSTTYSTQGGSMRTASVAAMVTTTSNLPTGRVRRVLTEREIDDLVF